MQYAVVTSRFGDLVCIFNQQSKLAFLGITSQVHTINDILSQAKKQLTISSLTAENLPSWSDDLLNGNFASIPLIVYGTDFQKKVWAFLCKIPSGTTVTYSDVAVQLKIPSAVRAVASAIARNPISLIIPCHRVISKTSRLYKYRWGFENKEHLINIEKIN